MCYCGFGVLIRGIPISRLKEKYDFTCFVNSSTGEQERNYEFTEVKYKNFSNYGLNMKCYDSGLIKVNGSIHKYFKNNNYDLFTFKESSQAFQSFLDSIGCSTEKATLTNLEYGINLILDFNPDIFLQRLISYKYRRFHKMGKRDGFGQYCEFSEYILKLYNKTKEYNLPYYILRIEKKVTDSKHFKKFEIATIQDLFKKENCEILLNDLLVCINSLLVDDKSIEEDKLTPRQQTALAKYRDSKFMEGLNKEERRNSKERFLDYIRRLGKENYLQKVKIIASQTVNKILEKDAPFRKEIETQKCTFPILR